MVAGKADRLVVMTANGRRSEWPSLRKGFRQVLDAPQSVVMIDVTLEMSRWVFQGGFVVFGLRFVALTTW